MGLKGELNTICLADIFQNLTLNQKEGTLIIEDAQSRKTFFFTADGLFAYSEGYERTDPLGALLVFRELLTSEQLEGLLNEVQNRQIFLEDLLQESQLIDFELLGRMILDCSKEEVYDLFLWKGAHFDFEEQLLQFENIDYRRFRRLSFGNEGVNSVLLEAVRRVDEWEAIFKIIPSFDEIFIPSHISLEEILEQDSSTQEIGPVLRSSQPIKQKVVALLNGRNTIQDLIRKSFLPRFEVCFALTHMLRNRELRPLTTPEVIYVADYLSSRGLAEQAIHFYLRASQQGGSDPSLMSKLAYAYEQLGQIERALELYVNYGLFCLQNHQIEDALLSFKRVVSLDANQIEAREHIYNIYLANPSFPDAKDFHFINEGLALASDMKKFGQVEKANAYLRTVVEQEPDNIELRHKLIEAYLDSGQKENAINQYLILAKIYQSDGNTASLVEIYEKILKINRSRTDIQNKLDAILLKKREQKRYRQKRFLQIVMTLLLFGGISFEGYREYEAYTFFQQKKAGLIQPEKASLLSLAQTTLAEFKKTPDYFEPLLQGYPDFADNYQQIKKEKVEKLRQSSQEFQWTLYGRFLIPVEINGFEKEVESEFLKILEQIKETLNQAFAQKLQKTKIIQEKESLENFQKIFTECEELFVKLIEVSEVNKKEFERLRQQLKLAVEDKKKQEELERRKNQEAQEKLNLAKQFEDQKKYDLAFRTIIDFLKNKEFESTNAYQKALIPVWVIANVPVSILVNGQNYSEEESFFRNELKKENLLHLKFVSQYRFEIQAEGFDTVVQEYDFFNLPPRIEVQLKKTYLWKSEEKIGVIQSIPIILEDKIVLGSSNNRHVYVLQKKTGQITWRWQNDPLGDFEYGAIFDEEKKNRFYICDRNGNIHCFAFPGFERIWTNKPVKNGKMTGPSIVSENRIPFGNGTYRGVCTSSDQYFVAYAEVNNELKLAFPPVSAGTTITSPPVLAKDQQIAYFPTIDGYIRGFVFSRKKVFRGLQVTVNNRIAPLTIDRDLQAIFFGTDSGQFYAVSYRKNLQMLWNNPLSLGGSVKAASVILDDFVYVGTTNGNIYKIVKTTGELAWKWPESLEERPGGFIAQVCVDELGNVYAGSKDSYLYALDARGSLKWKYKTEDEIVSPPIFDAGIIFFGSRDQYFYAIRR